MATLLLIRHAKAADRDGWVGSDRDRPLIGKGKAQAERLARHLDGSAPAVVAASPWLRCVETATPIAATAGLAVEPDPRLGYDAPDLHGWLVEATATHPGRNLVAVGHGDLIPQYLFDAGLVRAFERFRTGSLFRVPLAGGRPRPPAVYVDRDDLLRR